MLIALFWLVLSIAVGIAAGARGRSSIGWGLLAVLLSPLMVLLLLIAFPIRFPQVTSTTGGAGGIALNAESPTERAFRLIVVGAMLMAMVAAIVIIVSQRAHAQSPDPYAGLYQDQRAKDLDSRKQEWLGIVGGVYHAYACHIYDPKLPVAPELILSKVSLHYFSYAELSQQIYTPGFNFVKSLIVEKMRAAAAKPGGCDYWAAHPDETYALRRQASCLIYSVDCR